MSTRVSYRAIWRKMNGSAIALFAMLFLFVQSMGLAHATEHFDAPHEHDGVACVMVQITSEATLIAPPVRFTVPCICVDALQYTTLFQSINDLTPQGRVPPPRAPPCSF